MKVDLKLFCAHFYIYTDMRNCLHCVGLLARAAVEQTNPIINGPGAVRDSAFPIPKLTSSQKDRIKHAEKFAMEQNIKTVLVKQTLTHQTQVYD